MNSFFHTIKQIIGITLIFALVLIIIFAKERITAVPLEHVGQKALSVTALRILSGPLSTTTESQVLSGTSTFATTTTVGVSTSTIANTARTIHEATFDELQGGVATVTRVVDGDTLVITYGSKEYKLRLIGLNTPETVDPRKTVECFGREASSRAKELLLGKTIGIELDRTQGFKDRYDRVLAYVFIVPPGLATSSQPVFFNKQMIAEGYGYEYTYDKPYTYQMEFKAAQREAANEGRGLWKPGVCGVK